MALVDAVRPGVSHLTVTVKGKEVSMAISKMDDATLKAALLRADNRDALKPAYHVVGDKILLRPVSPIGTVAPGTPAPIEPGGGSPGVSGNHGLLADPVIPATAGPVAATPTPWAWNPAADPDYVKAYGDAEADFLGKDGGFASQLAGLTAKGFTGQTMYDYLMGQAEKARHATDLSKRREAARKGAAVGGWIGKQRADVGNAYLQTVDQAVRDYGTNVGDSRSKAYALTQERTSNRQAWDMQRPRLTDAYRAAATNRHNLGG